MALSLNALVTEVQSRIHRTDMNTTIQNALLEQITWLEQQDYWPWTLKRDSTTIALASGTYEYSLPGDFLVDLSLSIIQNNKEDVLDQIAFNIWVDKYADISAESGGQPTAYTIGYLANTDARRLLTNIPADATYACELVYFAARTDATATGFPAQFTELEKLALVFKTAAHIQGTILNYSTCTGQRTCHCVACESNRWLGALAQKQKRERNSKDLSWRYPKRVGTVGGFDARSNQKTYNV